MRANLQAGHTTSSAAGDDSASPQGRHCTQSVHYWLLRTRVLRTSVHPLWVLSRPSVAQGDTSVLHQQKTRHHTKQREKYQFLQPRRYSRRTVDVQFLNPPFRLAPISARSPGISALTDLQNVQHRRPYLQIWK